MHGLVLIDGNTRARDSKPKTAATRHLNEIGQRPAVLLFLFSKGGLSGCGIETKEQPGGGAGWTESPCLEKAYPGDLFKANVHRWPAYAVE